MVDKNLTWKYHIDAITAKISKTIGQGTYISELRHSIKRILLYIYYTLIHLHLGSCCLTPPASIRSFTVDISMLLFYMFKIFACLIAHSEGCFPLSRNFYVRTCVKFPFANTKIEAMHERSLVTVKVEPHSTSN